MRDLFIVCYDIANTKRRVQFRKALLPYSTGGQKSCYECWLTPSDFVNLNTVLHALLDAKEDKCSGQVISDTLKECFRAFSAQMLLVTNSLVLNVTFLYYKNQQYNSQYHAVLQHDWHSAFAKHAPF